MSSPDVPRSQDAIRVRRTDPPAALLTLSGPLDAEIAQAFLATVEKETKTCPRLVVDLGEVGEIGSVGLGAMVRALKLARDAGGEIVFARPTPEFLRLLDETGLDQILRTFDDAAAAQAALA